MSKSIYRVRSVEDERYATIEAKNAAEAVKVFVEQNFDNLSSQFTAEAFASGKPGRVHLFDVEFDLVPEITVTRGTSIKNAFKIMEDE